MPGSQAPLPTSRSRHSAANATPAFVNSAVKFIQSHSRLQPSKGSRFQEQSEQPIDSGSGAEFAFSFDAETGVARERSWLLGAAAALLL